MALSHDLAGTGDDQTLTFTRNPLGQIAGRTGSNAAYDWDEFVAESTSYSHNGLNQMTAAGATNFSYDGRGNLTSDGTKTYTYDAENRLTAVSGGATLAYDPLGRLYEVSDGVTATKFLTDGAEVIAEYDAAGSTVLRRYVHGPGIDEPLVWYEGAGTSDRRWLAADERGSITAANEVGSHLEDAWTFGAKESIVLADHLGSSPDAVNGLLVLASVNDDKRKFVAKAAAIALFFPGVVADGRSLNIDVLQQASVKVWKREPNLQRILSLCEFNVLARGLASKPVIFSHIYGNWNNPNRDVMEELARIIFFEHCVFLDAQIGDGVN